VTCFITEVYLNCIAAEAVTALALYGNVTFRKRYLYPQWLREALKIDPKHFKSFQKSEIWIFSNVNSVEKLRDSTISFRFEDFEIRQLLERVQANCRLEHGYIEPILAGINACTEEWIAQAAEVVSETIIQVCCQQAFPKTSKKFAKKTINNKVLAIAESYISNKLSNLSYIVSARTFVERLFRGEIQSLLFVTWLVGIAEFVCKDKSDQLQNKVIDLFENLLLSECTFLFVTNTTFCGKDSKFFGVAPFANPSTHLLLTEKKRMRIVRLYKKLVPAAKWMSDVNDIFLTSSTLEDFQEEVCLSPVNLFFSLST